MYRFMNHSCSPNAKLYIGRVGTTHRIVYVRTLVPIGANEQITIKYGDGWFGKDELCLCGSNECKKPPASGAAKKVESTVQPSRKEDENSEFFSKDEPEPEPAPKRRKLR